jgi:hypothetical protein
MKLKPNDFRKIVVASFLAVPALSSLISTIHIITFFGLGNMTWMAIILALAFEIGSIASLMTLAVLDKINRFAVWFIFVVLVAMQMLGNVYYTYDYISQAMATNPQWIDSFIDLVEMMTMQKLEQRTTKFILSLLIGLPIPIISLAFLKSVSDYLKPEEKTKSTEKQLEELVVDTNDEVIETSEVKEEIKSEETQSEETFDIDIEETEEIEIVEETKEDEIIENIEENNTESIVSEEEIATIEEETILENTEEIVLEETKEEIVVEEQIESENIKEEEIKDIYEKEPTESFFDDSTIEEQHDDFIDEENEDEKKKSIIDYNHSKVLHQQIINSMNLK